MNKMILVGLLSSIVAIFMIGCSSKPPEFTSGNSISKHTKANELPHKSQQNTHIPNSFLLKEDTSYSACRQKYESITNSMNDKSEMQDQSHTDSTTKKWERLSGGNFIGEDQVK